MIAFIVIAAAMCALAVALMTRPLWQGHVFGAKNAGPTDEVDALSRQLGQLQELHANGTLTDEQYAEGKAVVERKVLAAVSGASDPPIDARTRAPPSPGLAAALALALFVVAGGGYYWIGSPGGLQIAPGAASAASEGAAMAVEGGTGAHPLSVEQISAMIDQLVTSLKSKPEDADGWQMLARSYVAIGKHGQAIGAFKEAARLRPADADLLADYADAWAVTNNRSLKGDPIKLVDRALQLNPANSKALALAGTAAFDRRDYKAAVAYWERLAKVEPAGSTYGEQVRSNIDEARQLAGLPPTTVRATADAPSGDARGAQVSGTVTLAAKLSAWVAADDTLFVFARAADGQRMPLGVLRKRVRDLPLQFRIDDSSAMSPEARLSGVARVVVVARISKSGSAAPQPGDLQGMTAEVAVGASGLKIDIDQEVVK